MEQQDNKTFDLVMIGAMFVACLAPFILIFILCNKRIEPMEQQTEKQYKIKNKIEHECGSNGWLVCDQLTFSKIKDYLFSSDHSFIVIESEKVIDNKETVN